MRPPNLLDVASEPRFRGLSAEEIYALMQQEKQHEEEGQKEGMSDGGKDGSGPPEPSASPSPDPSVPPSPSPDPLASGPPEPAAPGIGDFEPPPPEPDRQPGDEAGADSGLEGDWQIATEQLAKMRGNCPGAASQLVEEMKKPKVSWREVLREFIRQKAKNDWSFARPNWRHLARGFVLPSLHNERMGRLVCAFDSSGSTRRYVGDFQAEVQAALDECLPQCIDVIVCDAAVQHVQRFEPGDTVSIDAKGGGGTDFRPVFEHIDDDKDEDESPLCVVYLTDLDGSFPSVEPEYPVLWCVPEGSRYGSRLPPFGEVAAVK